MTPGQNGPKVAYVLKRFPRLSETFILNEILELERRGVDVTVFAFLKPNDGKFHAQVAQLKARVRYFEELDVRRWHEWVSAEWSMLSPDSDRIWEILRESLERGDSIRANEIWWGVWVAAQAKRLGIDHLHSHFGTMSSTVAWFASRVSGIPFSFTVHAKDIYAYDMSAHRLREKMHDAARVITVTHYNRDYLTEQAPELPADRVRVVYNGVDLQRFRPNPVQSRDDALILSVGRLIPKKGFDDLLEACALLARRGTRFRCVIVGDGPDEFALRQQCTVLGLKSRVEFVGALAQDDVLALMHQATVLALACKEGPDKNRDALPTVLLEAMAAGLPCVSTAFSGIPEIVESGVEGLLVPPGDPQAMGDALALVLEDPDMQARFAIAGRRKAETRFDLAHNADALVEVFETSAAARSRWLPRAQHPARTTAARQGRRVLVLSADRGIAFGGAKGAAVHLREFSEALHDQGYAPTLVVAKRDVGSTYDAPYPVHCLPKKTSSSDDEGGSSVRELEGQRNRATQRLVGEIYRTSGFDLLYERYSLFGTGGRMAAQELGVPFVLEVNAPLVEEAQQYRTLEDPAMAREVERYLFTTADHIVTVSAEVRDYVRGIVPTAAVTVIRNGVNMERFAAAQASPFWRRKLGAAGAGDFIIGFVGRVRPWHGIEGLMDAFAAVAASDATVRLAIVGAEGTTQDELRAQAESLGIADRVRLVDSVPPDAVPHLLQCMDVCVAPYPQLEKFYFSPLKVYEYMAAGRPIVASSVGQLRGTLQDGVTAVLVPPGDVEALAAALGRVRADAPLCTRIGRAAMDEARRSHTWSHRIVELGHVIETLQTSVASG